LAERPELGAVDLERYELGQEIGRGGMGVVYEAFDRELRRPVALKVLGQVRGLSQEARQRFLREARAAARLVHPHIAAVYDAEPEAIAMQRVRGPTLAEAELRDPRELAALIRDAALAIHYAHGEGVVHRDLKPANLMYEPGERPHVFVMDFGLAKEIAVDATVSASGVAVGTPAYMAPEQVHGTDEVGPRSDVYGLGATLYACLAGRPPFEERDVVRLLRRVVEDDPPPLRSIAPDGGRIDADLATIVAKCLAKEPAARYASALALASDLERWLNGEPIQARPPSVVYRLRRFVSRRQGVITVGLLAAAGAFLVALPFIVGARQRRQVAEAVLEVSLDVEQALDAARAVRSSGAGREQSSPAILGAALERCRAFPGGERVGAIWFFRGRLLREMRRHEEAVSAFDRAQELHTDRTTLARERGLALAALYQNGLPVLGEDPPPELDAWRARGARDLERALSADPYAAPTPERVYAEGQCAWLAGEPERAIVKLKEVVEMDPGHQQAHLSLSKLYLSEGRSELGMRHSVIATDLLRGNWPAYLARASMVPEGELRPDRELLAVDGLRELLIDFALLMQVEPGNVHSYGLRGQVHLREALRGRERADAAYARTYLAHAIREFSMVLELRPDYPAAMIGRGVARAELARVLHQVGATEEAVITARRALADYDAVLANRPNLPVARYDRGLLRIDRASALHTPAPMRVRELTLARKDADVALAFAGNDHPWRERFERLAVELTTVGDEE